MDDKQLDFNQPLLSVRRFSSTQIADDKMKADNVLHKIPPPPFYKSELKSGPIRNPGAVPFLWEQFPGRPKDESKLQNRPPVAPKLPPGRITNVKQVVLEKDSENPSLTRSQKVNGLSSHQQNVLCLDKDENKDGSCKNEKDEDSCESEDGDEAYVDALDTLSHSESFFLNCSVNGLSELDGGCPEPSGTFSLDVQTLDFMMGRFLPAAKAVASETPQHSSRRQPVALPKQVTKVISWDKQPPSYQYRAGSLQNYTQYEGEGESDDEDDDHDEPEDLSVKMCGLFPRLKGSLCLLNPIPGMRGKSRIHMQAKSSYTGFSSGSDYQLSRNIAYERRSMPFVHQKDELHHKTKLTGTGISTYQTEVIAPLFHKEERFHGIPDKAMLKNFVDSGLCLNGRKLNNFPETLCNDETRGEVGSASPVIEKTLYVDSVHTVETPNAQSTFSIKEFLSVRENEFEILIKERGMERRPLSDDFSLQEIKKSNISSVGSNQDSVSSRKLILPEGKLGVVNKQPPMEENQENPKESFSEFPLPPPLPKSPSDSWLWRTLPSISRNNAFKAPSVDSKWGTIVKPSNTHHGRLSFSEEQLTPVPEN